MNGRTIFHIDCNSAFLSWEAVRRLQRGESIDLRTVASVIGGDAKKRRGIVLAKSEPAKKKGIRTGHTLYEARAKCADLITVPPDYALYIQCSNAMTEVLKEYSPIVERYSVDECFLDLTQKGFDEKKAYQTAHTIRKRIKSELGFTVNVGISTNKLLAKMASELKKPDLVHTMYPHEISEKMWPLPVCELFMVGVRTCLKLYQHGIITIGQLAATDRDLLKTYFKSFGDVLWHYANGRDHSQVIEDRSAIKGIGNATTTAFDVTDTKTARLFLLSLSEMTAMRLRLEHKKAQTVCVFLRNHLFGGRSHQHKFPNADDSTMVIYQRACTLFDEMWTGQPLRLIGIRLSCLTDSEYTQLSLLDQVKADKISELDESVDSIRARYGNDAIKRASFLHSGVSHMNGGVFEDYPMMSSLL